MSERLETAVVVTDKGSQTFNKVGDSAQKMGKTIDMAATQSSTALGRINTAGAKLGAASLALQGLFSDAARGAAEGQAEQARLAQAIENTGESYDQYADRINEAQAQTRQLGLDDDDLSEALSLLTIEMGNAGTALDQVTLIQDLARARNLDLADSAQLIAQAYNGNIGALRRHGIMLEANATGEEALAALQQRVAGQAEAYAQTTSGFLERTHIQWENLRDSLLAGNSTVASGIALLPGLSAGWTLVGGSIGALIPEIEGATRAEKALSLAMGPVGIAGLAIGAGVAVYELSKHLGSDLKPSADVANEGLKTLGETLYHFTQIASVIAPLANETVKSFTFIKNAVGGYQGQLESATEAVTKAHAATLSYMQSHPGDVAGLQDKQQAEKDAKDALDELTNAQDYSTISVERLNLAEQDANKILQDTGPAAEAVRGELSHLVDDVNSGRISWTEYIDRVIQLSDVLPAANLDMIKAAGGANKLTGELNNAGQRMTGLVGSARILGDQLENLDGQSLNAANSLETSRDRTVHYNDAATGLVGSIQVLGDEFTDLDGDSINATNSITKGTEAMQAQTAAVLEQAQSLGLLDTELERLIAAGVSTWAERTSQRVQGATEALGTAISVIIDGTKNLSSQSQGLNDWAVDLINVVGIYGKIDDLLAHGQITLTTYNRAQDAGTRIIADNALVQEDLLRIQAKQAPILADAADHQAKYIDQLADMPALQQEVALGWADQAESLKAQDALQLAAAASAGELGAAGTKAASSAITAAAQADPILKDMLQDMGLISVGAHGEITVNFPNADQTHEDTVNLTNSIDELTVALGGVPPYVHTDITATDNASPVALSVREHLDALQGYTANTVISVGLVGPGVGYQVPYQHGGIIPHAQTGMIPRDSRLAIVGEAGPELVRLPGGSMVYPHGASMEMAKRGGGTGDIHLHNSTINLYPPDQNVYHALRGQLYSGSR